MNRSDKKEGSSFVGAKKQAIFRLCVSDEWCQQSPSEDDTGGEQMKSTATAVSTIVALACFGALYVGGKTVISVDDVQSIRVDLDLSYVARRVDERFLSVAIDASLIAEEKFMNLLK